MATATDHLNHFLEHVRNSTTIFTRANSCLEPLLNHLDSEIKNSVTPPRFAGAFQRNRFDTAIGLCAQGGNDPRLAEFRPAIWCLARVWGTTLDYPVRGNQELRVLHVAILKYDTQACQYDDIATRKILLQTALTDAERMTRDYVNGLGRKMWGVLVAPEYMFAKPAPNDDHAVGDERHLSEGSKAGIEGWLRSLSGNHPRWLLFPGTIAWKKALARDRAKYIRRHKLANPALTDKALGKRFDAKTLTRTEKAEQALETFKTVFTHDHDRDLSDDKTALEAWCTFPPDPDWWFVTDEVTNQKAHCATTGKTEYWTKDIDDARRVVTHKAPTNQEKLLALRSTAKRMARNTCTAFLAGERVLKYHKMNDYHEVLDDPSKVVYVPGTRTPVCTVDGVRFGVEICLDHARETTKKLVSGCYLSSAPEFLVLMSAQVALDASNLPGGVEHVAHASSNQSYNTVMSRKANAIAVEADNPGLRVVSLVLQP